jgi:predicted nucleic acid-binding protein
MTPMWVLDTSVIIKWVRQEEVLADRALALLHAYLDGQSQISVPSLLAYEIANLLRYKTDLEAAQVETAIQGLFNLGLHWFAPTAPVTHRAVVIAREHETSVYDASFAALAEALGAIFITADERLVRGLAPLPYVAFLGDVEVTA